MIPRLLLVRVGLISSMLGAHPAFAQEPPATPPGPSTAASAAPSQPPPAIAEPARTHALSPEETSTEVLRLYVAEDDAGALRTVQEGIDRCDLASRRECPDVAKARLLRDLGIVQAGAYRDHAAAVTAFREARRLDPTLGIPPDLLVDRVRAAFVEAGGTVSAAPPPAEAEAAEAVVDPSMTNDPNRKKSRYDVGDTFVLAVGSWGGGGDSSGTVISELGGAVSGLWHVAGPLAVGARVSAAGTVSSTTTSTGAVIGTYGVVGAAALLGLVPRGERNTGYILLGLGPDYIPNRDHARTVLSLAGGASFGGFTFGGMPAVIFNQGATGGAIWFFIGWGNYVKD